MICEGWAEEEPLRPTGLTNFFFSNDHPKNIHKNAPKEKRGGRHKLGLVGTSWENILTSWEFNATCEQKIL